MQSVHRLHELAHESELEGRAISHFARHLLSQSKDLHVHALVGSYDIHDKDSQLFWLDNGGVMYDVDYAAHGDESRLLWSLLDRNYSPELTFDDATALIRACWRAVRVRSPRSLPRVKTILIDEKGHREVMLPELSLEKDEPGVVV